MDLKRNQDGTVSVRSVLSMDATFNTQCAAAVFSGGDGGGGVEREQ